MKLSEFEDLLYSSGNIEKILLAPKERRELLSDARIMPPLDIKENGFFVYGIQVIVDERVEKYEIVYLQCKNCGGRSWEKGKCKYCNK